MNVVFIQKSTGRGGAKNSLLETLQAISSDGKIHAEVIVGERGPFVDHCAALGIPTTLVQIPEWRKFFDRLSFSGAMKRIATPFAGRKIDWVISNEMWWGPHAARIAKHLGCRSAAILRDGIATIPKALQYRLFENDLILPVSSTIAGALTSHPKLAARVHVLFDPVSLPPENAAHNLSLDQLLEPFTEVRRWLLVVGKLSFRKNQADAVRITRSLIDNGDPDLGLLLAGDIDPAYRPEMDRVIHETGLARRVAMIGNFDGITSLLQRAHILLLPSFREGLPRSLVEAITADKPAFSYPCEGVEDIYVDFRGTFVSTESTADSLYESIRRAWNSPEITGDAHAAVRQRALSLFSPQAHIGNLTSLLTAARSDSR